MQFSYAEPLSLEEAVQMMAELRRQGFRGRYLAGGTDLLPLIKRGLVQPDTVINLKLIAELNSIRIEDGYLRIGALTTLKGVARSALVKEWSPAAATAANKVASPVIRAMGTVGGNLLQGRRCWYYNQSREWRDSWSPCYGTGGQVCHRDAGNKSCQRLLMSDLVPALIVAGVRLEIASTAKRSEVLLEELADTDTGVIRLPASSLLISLKIPMAGEFKRQAYVRMSVRQTIDYPEVSIALELELDRQKQSCCAAEVVVGSVCPGPFRSALAANVAKDKPLGEELGRELGEAVATEIEQRAVGTLNFSKWYKLEMIRVMIKRTVADMTVKLDRGDQGVVGK